MWFLHQQLPLTKPLTLPEPLVVLVGAATVLGTVPRSRRPHSQFAAGTGVGSTSEIPRGNVLGQKCHEEEVEIGS